MPKGKKTCKILKEIRQRIAEQNDIELITSECTYQGDCLGTCPKCEAEVRYLEQELEKRQRIGKAAVVAGLSVGALFTASCKEQQKTMDPKPLAGDVVVERQAPDTIREDLVGLVRMFRENFTFDTAVYQNQMKDKFVFQGMDNLSIVGGTIDYEEVSGLGHEGKVCTTLEELINSVKQFDAPSYKGGESKMLEHIVAELKNKGVTVPRKGSVEVSFEVSQSGSLHNVTVVKGLNAALDEALVDVFKNMSWNPALYSMADDSRIMPFDCSCIQKIVFK